MGYLFLGLALTLNAFANTLLKIGVGRLGDLGQAGLAGRMVTNPPLLAGLVLFALNVLFYMLALSRVNLSIAYPIMTAGGILIVVTASVLYLGEPLTPLQMFGILLLILGIGLVTYRPLP